MHRISNNLLKHYIMLIMDIIIVSSKPPLCTCTLVISSVIKGFYC